MDLKHYTKQDCVAVWSNSKVHGQLIACASTNSQNSNLFDLEILSVDLADPSKQLKVQGKSTYNTNYRCLAWGTFGQKQGRYPYGLIFGGMENGSFTLWNPAEMIGKNQDIQEAHIDEQNSFLYAEQGEQEGYPIICAEWNSLKNNFLAFGSTSLLILDVAKDVSSPTILKPTSPHENTYITSVSWNKQVPHILASAGGDGLIALYDLKTSKSIFNFKDNSTSTNSRNIQIAWSKHISTQIAVTLDDEKKNQVQIWDLRNPKGPIVVIDKIHSKGINTMDWSQLDHDLILSASRDNQVVCWNYKEDQQPLSSRKLQSQVVKVAWAKNLPSVYSVTSANGISIYSLDDSNIHSYIPKWLKVSSSSTFNGNQSLITYQQQRGNTLQQYVIKPQIKKQLAAQISLLQQFMQNQQIDTLKEVKGEASEFWKLISTKKNQESDSDIYQFLGLNKDKIIKQVEKYTGKKRDSFTVTNSKSSKNNQKTKVSKTDYIPISGNDASDFFTKISLKNEPNLQKSFNKEDQAQAENVKYDMVERNFNWDIGKQKIIKHNMLIGNYQGAIDAALKCGRTAEALIIAYSMNQTIFNSTLKTFFTQTTDNFISGTLRYVAFKETEQLVKKYDLNKWKECIALIYSLSSADKRKGLLSQLAKRLEVQQPQSEQHQHAAIYTYVLAEEFEQILQIYQKVLDKQRPNSTSRKISLTKLGTRLLAIYTSLTVNVKITKAFERIIKQLALVCLQANKKLLSYNLLTKYSPQSSSKYIDYLIQNTQQLTEYRNNSNPIVSLPAMNKRQEKAKKVSRKQEEAPTNIKPIKQPKVPVKNAFNEPQNDIKVTKQKSGNTPPPPPPHPHGNVIRPNVAPQAQTIQSKPKGVPPPPPPPPKKQQHQSQDEDQEQQYQEKPQYHHPPPPSIKKGNVPPPPPPPPGKVIGLKPANPIFQQQPSVKKTPPPPPPPPAVIHQKPIQKQQPRSNPSRVPPPPPPGAKKQSQQQNEPVKKIVPPPGRNVPPPPPMKLPPKKQEQPEQDVEQQQYQEPQKKFVPPVRHNPPPPVKKTGPPPPPPPPTKVVKKVQSQPAEQEQQQQNSVQQAPKRGPPAPPRRVPPPPPGRR